LPAQNLVLAGALPETSMEELKAIPHPLAGFRASYF